MKAPHFTISSIEPADIEPIVQIADECRLSPWSPEDYREEAKRSDSILLRLTDDTGYISGFIVGRRVPGSSAGMHFDAEIYNIGVRRSKQRHGGGSILLKEFLRRCAAQAVEKVWLDVRVSNAGAIVFYKSFGFVEYTIRRGFYADPADNALVMKLDLGRSGS